MNDRDPTNALLLILRPFRHPHARDAFRVVWRDLEVGSIGLQVGASGRTFLRWSIDDNGMPCRELMGDTIGKSDAMAAFRPPGISSPRIPIGCST